MTHSALTRCNVAFTLFTVAVLPAVAQQPTTPAPAANIRRAELPAGYVIGPEDVLAIVFWRDKDMSAESVVVRPDGKVTLPLLNDIQAAGLTPDELRTQLMKAASTFVQDPNVTVIVREIHSRKLYITGNVTRPGTYPMADGLNVLQLIALAGGLLEYADSKHIVVLRTDQGRQQTFDFNYRAVIKQKHVEQNIALKPGDTVIVP